MKQKVDVIIPAYNEEGSIGKVVEEIPKSLVRNIIVVDNNSTDNTGEVAEKSGAIILFEPNPGYGNACLKGIEYLSTLDEKPGIVVFLDGDHSDYPEQMERLIERIVKYDDDLVIGSRSLGNREKSSMTPQQVFGNRLATFLMRLFWNARFTDLGPFRAIKYDKLIAIGMSDKNYGWTVEMQLKALKYRLKYSEVPVDYRKRIGKSKVSGTLKGSILAGYKILLLIFKNL